MCVWCVGGWGGGASDVVDVESGEVARGELESLLRCGLESCHCVCCIYVDVLHAPAVADTHHPAAARPLHRCTEQLLLRARSGDGDALANTKHAHEVATHQHE